MSLLPRDDSLALADRNQIDEICLAFEDEWLTGRRPVLEAYLRRIRRRLPGAAVAGIAAAGTGLSPQHSGRTDTRRLPGPIRAV